MNDERIIVYDHNRGMYEEYFPHDLDLQCADCEEEIYYKWTETPVSEGILTRVPVRDVLHRPAVEFDKWFEFDPGDDTYCEVCGEAIEAAAQARAVGEDRSLEAYKDDRGIGS